MVIICVMSVSFCYTSRDQLEFDLNKDCVLVFQMHVYITSAHDSSLYKVISHWVLSTLAPGKGSLYSNVIFIRQFRNPSAGSERNNISKKMLTLELSAKNRQS